MRGIANTGFPTLTAIKAPVTACEVDSMKVSLMLIGDKVYKRLPCYNFYIMLPILVSLGPIKIYSYGLFMAVGVFLSLYWWWKIGRDEHWEEISLFDSFFLFLLIYLIAGRGGYVVTHMGDLDTWYRMIAILAYPGINVVVGLVAGLGFLILFARAKGWEVWKALDSLVVALSLGIIFAGFGGLLNGSTPGIAAAWGVVYPGQAGRVFPVDLWICLWALSTFLLVSRVRKNFRFYSWYKGEASVAKEGLAALMFGVLVGIYYLVAGWIMPPGARVWLLPNQFLLGLGVAVICGYLIYHRSGKKNQGLNLLQWLRNKGRR